MSEHSPEQQPLAPSPPWDRNIKIIVALVTLALVVAIAMRFTDLIIQVIAAGIVAYVLTPLINWVAVRTPLSRGAAILIAYVALAIFLVAFVITVGVSTFNQVTILIRSVPTLVRELFEWLSATEAVVIGPFSIPISSILGDIDLNEVSQQLLSAVLPAVNQGARAVVVVFGSTVNVFTKVLFTFIVSVYLAFEMGRLGGYVSGSVYQPGYRRDAERILREFDRIWRAYLRGQIILGFIIFLCVWISLSILGVQNAFALGVLSGALEFLPVIGPFIGTAAAAIVSFFQPANPFGLDPVIYTLIVIGVMLIIQQIENNLLVPRIVGGALDLHALVVIVGVFMGSALLGIIGAILAAPVLATIKLLGSYAWRKMFDLPPFPEAEPQRRSSGPHFRERLAGFREGLRRLLRVG
jgi:predicted PurR-regulated permease PerM